MADAQLQFVIKAVDEASEALAKVKAATDQMKQSVDTNTQSLEKNTTAAGGTKTAHDNLAASVFKGVAVWDTFKQSISVAKDFLESSVGAFIDAQKKVDLTQATISSMGLSLSATMPRIKEFGDAMGRLGIDNEDAELSAARLAKAAGGDVAQGLKYAKAAADLTASGYGDLASNTDNLVSVLNGRGTVAMRQYNLAMSSSASTGEILNAIQGKITQSSEQFADTVPGKIKTVQNAYEQLKQTVGQGFVAALNDAIGSGADEKQSLDAMRGAAEDLQIVIYELVQGTIGLGKTFYLLGDAIWHVIEAKMDFDKGDFKGAINSMKEGVSNAKQDWDSLYKTLGQIADPITNVEAAVKKMNEENASLGKSVAKLGSDASDASQKSLNAFVKLEDKVVALKDGYIKLGLATTTELATMADAHVQQMNTINQSIAATLKSINDLNAAYGRQAGSDEAGVAQTIVASQSKVADLKKQMAKATTQNQYDTLKEQADAEQKNLDSSKDWQTAHAAAISAAQQRASETDLQRAIDDYTTKRQLADQQYQEQAAQLQRQLSDEQSKKNQEVALYTDKLKQIKTLLEAGNADYVKFSNDRLSQTVTEVQSEITLFQQLATAISAVRSASAGAVSSISTPSLPHKASGGSVIAGETYMVGESGAEMFTASQSGTITPNSRVGDGSPSVVINITGGYFLSDKVADDLSDVIMDKLKRKTRIGI